MYDTAHARFRTVQPMGGNLKPDLTLKTCLVYLLLLQSALQPLWVLASSSIVEYSQQEGYYRVPLPAARQISNLED